VKQKEEEKEKMKRAESGVASRPASAVLLDDFGVIVGGGGGVSRPSRGNYSFGSGRKQSLEGRVKGGR